MTDVPAKKVSSVPCGRMTGRPSSGATATPDWGQFIALVDDRLRREAHADTVGIMIWGRRNDHTVRYSLGRGQRAPDSGDYFEIESRASGRTPTPRRARLMRLLHEVIGPGSKNAHFGTISPSLKDHQP